MLATACLSAPRSAPCTLRAPRKQVGGTVKIKAAGSCRPRSVAAAGPAPRSDGFACEDYNSDRRQTLLSGAAALAAALAASIAPAATAAETASVQPITAAEVQDNSTSAGSSLTTYFDPVDQFQLQVPNNWTFGSGEAAGGSGYGGATGARRTLAWYPKGAVGGPRGTNVTVVVTNVSGEFTRLGSFGSASAFGNNLVNSMDQSFLLRAPSWARGKGPVQVARLLEAQELDGNYFIEYFVDNPTEGKKHLLSLVALGNNGRYNRLYTLTAQCPEEELATYRPTLNSMLASFVKPSIAPRRA